MSPLTGRAAATVIKVERLHWAVVTHPDKLTYRQLCPHCGRSRHFGE
ncbi:hypothetical protein [Ruegeria conchae]|nr:hypothetical protein [Ruegeria conchae]